MKTSVAVYICCICNRGIALRHFLSGRCSIVVYMYIRQVLLRVFVPVWLVSVLFTRLSLHEVLQNSPLVKSLATSLTRDPIKLYLVVNKIETYIYIYTNINSQISIIAINIKHR